MVERQLATNGRQPGDPAAAAAAVLKLAEHPESPTWLLLGSDAAQQAADKVEPVTRAREAWRDVSTSVDYTDAGLAARLRSIRRPAPGASTPAV